MIELNNNIKEYLYQKYNILYHTNFLNFDTDYELLYRDLLAIRKESFNRNEKIIIEQFDTDFYDNSMICGLHNRNTIECIRAADIPFFSIIFITNNYNLDKELEHLINKEIESFPIVLKTVSSKYSILEKYNSVDVNAYKIVKPAVCCMAGSKRSHRSSIYSFIKNKNFFEKISVTYKNEP